ncbi:MAG: DUF1697 domain-containing protein [Acidimicrobiia bacterium]
MSPGASGKKPTTYVALLRGINLGARNKVAMPALRALVESLGHSDVQTYIQSGNVVFTAGSGSSAEIAAAMEAGIKTGLGLAVPVVLRTSKELERATLRNPFLAAGADPAALHVAFLGSPATKAAAATLDPDRSPGDEFAVVDAEVYLHCPNGFGRSKLGLDWFEKKLGATATIRNWRTVTTLAELSRA